MKTSTLILSILAIFTYHFRNNCFYYLIFISSKTLKHSNEKNVTQGNECKIKPKVELKLKQKA